MNKTFPTLYKKTNTGAIQQWTIEVQDETACSLIIVTHGQVDGKLQSTSDTIWQGKNEGKANATTYSEQALAEAEAKWTKQKKKRYVESIEDAKNGVVDEIIEGGIPPMLAPSKIYPIFAKKLTFPVFTQPKLDGSRCIAVMEEGVCTLWSRTQKRINSVPHIEEAIENAFPGETFIFDGELYNHELRDEFEELMSLIRKDGPEPGHEVIQYHIYDLPSCNKDFKDRYLQLVDMSRNFMFESNPILILVNTKVANNDAEIYLNHEENLALGYEGSMVRDNNKYERGKRSYFLQKLKNFVDDEWPVIGAEEGRGKDAGTVGAFICLVHGWEGRHEFKPCGNPQCVYEFKCRMKTSYAKRRFYFENPKEWENKILTIKYQNLTADNKPRFGTGKGFRVE